MASIILVGYRGSGKTTVGNLLAARLGLRCIDTDAMVAKAGGVTIRDIFACIGQPYFQELEMEALEEALAMPNTVIATGGGIVMRPENRERLKKAGWPVVYLATNPELLHSRIQADANSAANRPNLTKLADGLEEVRHVLAIRDPLYREVATMVVDVTTLTPQQVADQILQQVQ
jgi:shikimate kinase